MNHKPTDEELEKRVQELENEVLIHTRAEETLRKSEKRYRSLVETSSDWLWEVDANGRYIYASPRIREILGYAPEEVIGRTPFDLMPEEEAQRVGAIFAGIAAKRRPFALLENVNLHRDGTRVVLETSGVPLFDSNGEFTGYRGMDRDITERKCAEEALKENERKFRAIFDQTFQFMGLLTIDGRLIEANRNALQFAGVQESDVIGKPYWETKWWEHSIEQKETLLAALKKAADGEFVRFESTHLSAGGNLHCMDFSLKPIKDEAGDVTFLIAEARDITERKRMEEALRESKAYLDAAIESIPFEFWAIDSHGRYITQNRICRERYGDIVGKRPAEICPNEHILKVWLDNNRRAFAGEPVQGEVRYVFGNEERYIHNVVSPIHDAGRILGILGINVDITERKRTEDRLKEYEKVVEGLEEMIAVVDKDYRYLIANRAFLNNRDMSIGQVAGRPVAEILGREVFEKVVKKELDECFKGNVIKYELKHNYPKLGDRDLFVWYFPIEGSAGVDRVACVMQDITERKRAEEEKKRLEAHLRQAQKLEAVGTLAGGIAHDFNNLLAPIIGYTEMALHNLPPTNPMRSGQEQILRAALRAKDLVKQILAFGRSSPEGQRRPVEISSIVKEALKFLRASLPTSIEIKHRIGTVMAHADPTQIHQILMNLCTNAAHAMGDKGILEVGLSRVDLSESNLAEESIVGLEPGPYLKLWVSDTGIGMDKVTLERIFDPFFTTKAVGKGSGLGLSVVNGIVKQHHGAITVQSDPGKGSTFSIYIPAIELNATENVEIQKPLPKGTEKILLIDDEQALVEMGTAVLEGLGYDIVAETESQRAYELFRENPAEFDLVITDYTMPKLTGLDLALAIRKIRPDIPVIICTGFSEKMTETTSNEWGLELLLKPYSVKQLSGAVRKVLDKDN